MISEQSKLFWTRLAGSQNDFSELNFDLCPKCFNQSKNNLDKAQVLKKTKCEHFGQKLNQHKETSSKSVSYLKRPDL